MPWWFWLIFGVMSVAMCVGYGMFVWAQMSKLDRVLEERRR